MAWGRRQVVHRVVVAGHGREQVDGHELVERLSRLIGRHARQDRGDGQ